MTKIILHDGCIQANAASDNHGLSGPSFQVSPVHSHLVQETRTLLLLHPKLFDSLKLINKHSREIRA